MQLSVEVLDHIFSFLLSDRQALSACSKVPLLSPIVERHLYYHVIVQIGKKLTNSTALEPEHLSNLVSENPHILNYVRILQIEPDFNLSRRKYPQFILSRLDKFANTLSMFPALRCIILTSNHTAWHWSSAFLAALEDRFNLPTIKEIHLLGGKTFPLSLLDACKHVKNLSLSGSCEAEGQFSDSTLPQLKSLALSSDWVSSPFLAWLKCHINELESLECACLFLADVLPELLRVCSETLNKLEVVLMEYSHGVEPRGPFVELFSVPPNLQQLTIRTAIHGCYGIHPGHSSECHLSNLPAAAGIINQLISSPRYLRLFRVLNIDIDLSTLDIDSIIDFSPLKVLGAASLSIPRINLYVHAHGRPAITHTELMPLLDNYEDIMESIRTGVLVVYPGEMAPDA